MRVRIDGLSPRVRGNRVLELGLPAQRGSIPACAGEPSSGAGPTRPTGVYPRVCGGTAEYVGRGDFRHGLSPRVRGNRRRRDRDRHDGGSIPACAGEPGRPGRPRRIRRVYPRVCGGTPPSTHDSSPLGGLSPRVRGNHPGACAGPHPRGSIPACAGEPSAPGRSRRPRWVYPRVCGGTRREARDELLQSGLSPRVRGNRHPRAAPGADARSIPACAGEPTTWRIRRSTARVYPRVCGGTEAERPLDVSTSGLSPRVRGNHDARRGDQRRAGSIPACAGEPPPRGSDRRGGRVYPRVCGGTQGPHELRDGDPGLSPRVRGNRVEEEAGDAPVGSIPACAGEPSSSMRRRPCSGVYPRVCGGTGLPSRRQLDLAGLSPRVRGNRERLRHAARHAGSIPACAGEPARR